MGCKTPLLRVTSKTSSSSSAAADIVGILLDGKGPAGTGAVMLGGVASAGAVAMAGMVGVLRVVSVAKVAVTVVAAVQVVTKVAVGTEKTARSKRASPRPHHDRERLRCGRYAERCERVEREPMSVCSP